MARGEFGAARPRLAGLVEGHPREVRPRVILSHALLQEGMGPAAAERALREVLTVGPGNAEAEHNLQILLGQQTGVGE